ncbi:MAG: organomercurial lyase [Acidimicrobiales bacterium]
MTETHACNDAAFLSSVEGYQALPQLLRLLTRGEPLDLVDLADTAGSTGADLARIVRAQPGSEWDGDGRLVGFGITPLRTDYRFLVGGKTFYTWCASDTLFFTVILGEHTVAETTCPTTGVPIRLEITPQGVTSASPSEAVVSQLHRRDLVENLRSDVCDHGHFFASPSAAAGWIAEHPDGQVLSVADAFADCLAACEQLGWLSAEAQSR